MALDEEQADDLNELTDEDKEMLEKILEVAGPQAVEDAGGTVMFTDNIVTIEGRNYSMDVTVELTPIAEG